MKKLVVLAPALAALGAFSLAAGVDDEESPKTAPALRFKMKGLSGKEIDLAQYQGKVLLMVNTASECGYTPQYEGLQELHKKYSKKGLAILGFPSNNFGMQEPGTNEEIATFCKANYGVEFDMFSKVVVKGEEKCALYEYLTNKKTNGKFAGEITWNFEKFLINRKGEVVGRFAPRVEPSDKKLVAAIEAALEQE